MIIHDVEQNAPEWDALRAGIPTASEFSKLVTSKGEPSKQASTYAITLAIQKFHGGPLDAWTGNEHTERGHDIQDAGLALYEFLNEVSVRRAGFVTDDYAGCSPDGFVGDDGLVEVKCLKAENHVKAILYAKKHGRCPPDYVQQTQGQLLVCERQWCDLVFYHPVLPPLILRQEPDVKLRDALASAINDVLKERDLVLAAIQTMQDQQMPALTPTPPVDLGSEAPVF